RTVTVIPTASGRTVYCSSLDPPLYFKLHYDGILGRVDRKLPVKKAVAGFEISEELTKLWGNSLTSTHFSFLPEPFAIIKTCTSNQIIEEIGCVLRNTVPYPHLKGS